MLLLEVMHMAGMKYTLYEPNETTLERVKEVQFWIFLQAFLFKYNQDNQFIIGLVEDLAQIFNCKPHQIRTIISYFDSPAYKPDKEEIVISSSLLGMNVREITKIASMGIDTYYRYLKGYIKKEQPGLVPRLPEDLREDIEKFLQGAEYMFRDVSSALKGFEIYDVN